MIKLNKKGDHPPAERLFAQLSPAARRKYFDTQLAEDFPAFVMKVFETVSGGDVFLSNCPQWPSLMAMQMGLLEEPASNGAEDTALSGGDERILDELLARHSAKRR